MRRLFSILLTLFMLVPINANSRSVSFSYELVGKTLIISGVHPDGEGKQVTFIATKDGFSSTNVDVSKIIGLDQVTTGVNGGFVIRAGVNPLNDFVTIMVGGTDMDEANEIRDFLTTSPLDVTSIPDNSMIIGNDAYDMESPYLTSENVVESVAKGGHFIAFKIGGMWYDLMNPDARTAKYLTPKNAVPDDIARTWDLDKWYQAGVLDMSQD